MDYETVIWNDDEDGNTAHIVEHGLTKEDVEEVILESIDTDISRSTGRPILFGYTRDGRYIAVVYEELDEFTIYPITAFEIE